MRSQHVLTVLLTLAQLSVLQQDARLALLLSIVAAMLRRLLIANKPYRHSSATSFFHHGMQDVLLA